MTGASSRFIFLLTNPVSFLHHRPSTFFRSLRRRPLTTLTSPSNRHHLRYSHYNSHIPIKFSQNYCSRATNYSFQDNNQVPAKEGHVSPVHPWPEWSRLLDSLYNAGYFNGNCNVEDEFVVTEKFSMEFVDAVNSCLAFARDKPDILGWLPRSDIKVLVDDGYPFLFKNAVEIEIKMRAFLQVEGSNEATSVDLMMYILSYVSNFIVYPERNIKEATESCVRRLLKEMANVSYRDRASDQYEQTPRIVSPNITMKRGDWICAKCNFMNFARNAKCLECEELRPQRQLANGEWDCPRCNFFNYRKNVVCMKCECRRPDDAQLHGSSPGQTYFPNKQTHDSEKENRTETWFKKVMELHGLTGQPRDIPHDDLPIRKEEDHFTNNNDKDGRFSPYQRQQAMEHGKNSSFAPFVPFPPDYFAKKHDTKSTESTVKPTNENSYSNNAIINKKLVQGTENHQMRSTTNVDSRSYISNRTIFKGEMNSDLCSNQFRRNERKPESNRTLFSGDMNTSSSGNQFSRNEPKPEGSRTLFSGDMNTSSSGNQFTRNEPKPEGNRTLYNRDINTNSSSNQLRRNEPKAEDNRTLCSGDMNTDSFNNEFRRNEPRPEVGQRIPESMSVRSGWTGKSLEGSAVTEPDPLDMSEEAKAERWFKRVAQIKDISELSQIPDEDFPSIMPMRKGVNRFVVSKRKTPLERRLTSPQYRKNLRIVSSDPMKKEGNDDS